MMGGLGAGSCSRSPWSAWERPVWGALQAYADGIKDLITFFPEKWPVIVTTDLVVRTERWAMLKEACDRAAPPGFDPVRPWNYVIPAAAYGSDDLRVQAWWSRMLVLPATLSHTQGQTANLINILEGVACLLLPRPSP